MTTTDYLEKINTRYRTGITTEHSFRGDLQSLVETMVSGVMATNEPTRIACGAPDFIITKKNIPLGYIEAKDIGVDLHSKTLKEQFDRYRHSLDNLIFTDYLDFHFYKSGEFVTSVRIARTEGNKIIPLPDKIEEFNALLKNFCSYAGQTIKSSKTLAEMMAGKARMLANVIENALNSDDATASDSSLKEQMSAFSDILIHDITRKEFADIYAQTIAYGMFAARLHDASMDSFTRQEAAELIPKSNPFLRKLFGYIAGPDIDERILWIVDALADIFRATDVAALLKNFGKATQQQDPIIHFYETFLAEYDPKLRKARGVWYTPEPVVNFIVRAVDDILKTEFDLPDGLADRSKIKIKTKAYTKATADKRSNVKEVEREEEVHKVQILDPATGTGTFLAEVVKQVYKKFEGQQGLWSNYVEEHLVPRLNGFELLMASYAMAHLKLDLLLTETGYKPRETSLRGTKQSPQRLRVYLTNSLEEHHPDTGTLFANWLSTEANEANHIKRDTPVMVVMGNPPYAISSTNKGKWIQNLIADYKKDLNEKKINIDDDYIKFIRYGEYFIEKNGEGILAYISNNSFIDGITHRQMRKHLLETFDKIYILDLHGSAKKNETAVDGSKDENVFDIQQGVSINLFVKTNEKKKGKLAEVSHCDLHGLREEKYNTLFEKNLKKIKWNKLKYKEPNYFFVPKNFEDEDKYSSFLKIVDILPHYNSGIQTKRDDFCIQFENEKLDKILSDCKELSTDTFRIKYHLPADGRDWKVEWAIQDLLKHKPIITDYFYRPFDNRKTFYTGFSKGFMGYPRHKTMYNVLNKDNILLNLCRQQSTFDFQHAFLSKVVTDLNSISIQTKEQTYAFPLYLYPETTSQQTIDGKQARVPNLNKEIVKKIAEGLGLGFVNEKEALRQAQGDSRTFAPIDILDYIYAVLHSPTYREKYKEFLKIDFPRVPYPKDAATFWQLVKLGGELRQLHLLESNTVRKPITHYLMPGTNIVDKVKFVEEYEYSEIEGNKVVVTHYTPTEPMGNVYINDTQCFSMVPKRAWEFYIGGYQPAQKWLKDRKDRQLSFNDIVHYQRIIVALSETDRIMQEVDKIEIE